MRPISGVLLLGGILYLLPSVAYAFGGGQGPIATVICGAWELILTDFGRGIATLAVAALGVGATLGKVSWGLAITVAVGIAVMFNADYVAVMLTGQTCIP